MIFKFFRSKTTFTIIALKVVTCTPTFARVTEPAPSQEIGWCEQFSWTCRSFTENFRWLKPATQTCGWTFSPLFHPISFIYKDKHSQKARKHVVCYMNWRAVDQIQRQSHVFLGCAVELWSSKVEIPSLLWITQKLSAIRNLLLITSFSTKWIQMKTIFEI